MAIIERESPGALKGKKKGKNGGSPTKGKTRMVSVLDESEAYDTISDGIDTSNILQDQSTMLMDQSRISRGISRATN